MDKSEFCPCSGCSKVTAGLVLPAERHAGISALSTQREIFRTAYEQTDNSCADKSIVKGPGEESHTLTSALKASSWRERKI